MGLFHFCISHQVFGQNRIDAGVVLLSLLVLGSWVLCRHQRQHQCQHQRFVLFYSNGLQPYLSYYPGLDLETYSRFEVLAGYGRGPRAPVSPAHVVSTMCFSMSSAGSGRGPRAPVSPACVGATMCSLMSMFVLPPQRLHSGSSSVQHLASVFSLMSTPLLLPQRLHQGSSLVRRPSTMCCLMPPLLLPPQRLHQGLSLVRLPSAMCFLMTSPLLPPQRLHQGSSLVQRPWSRCPRRSYSYMYNKPLLQANLSVGRWTPEFHRYSQCRAYHVSASHLGK